MKRLKRIASQPVRSIPIHCRRLRSVLAPLLPGLLISLAGLLAAAVLLGVALHTDQRQQAERLAGAWGQSQADALQQALQRLNADTEAAAASPALLEALASGDAERHRAAERSLAHWPGLVDAHLSRRGQAQLDRSRPAPVSFAALDLLRRAENGQHPAPEAYRVNDRWLLYSVATLRPGPTQPVMGTLLIATELDRLLTSLPPLPAGVGQLRLIQQFSNAPAQLLLQRGQAGGEQPQVSLPLDNPYWTLTFQPDAALATPPVPLPIATLAALLALAGILLGLQRVVAGQGRRLRSDAAELERMVRELSSGKTVQPASLDLSPLDALARRLTDLPRPPSPLPGPIPIPAATPPDLAPIDSLDPPRPAERQDTPVEDIESLLQDTDILDILDEEQICLASTTRSERPQ